MVLKRSLMMGKFLIATFIITLFITLGYGKSVNGYLRELRNLTDEQSIFLVLAYEAGKRDDLSLGLAAIIWKESSFGVKLVNKTDGKYGSFGIGQILLQSAASRTKVNLNSKKARNKLIQRLITDHKFNLKLAIAELLYWKSVYKEDRKSKWWYTNMLASYNAGWRGVRSRQGKEYAEDIKKRVAALKKYIVNDKYWTQLAYKYMVDIRKDYMKKRKK